MTCWKKTPMNLHPYPLHKIPILKILVLDDYKFIGKLLTCVPIPMLEIGQLKLGEIKCNTLKNTKIDC